MDKKELEKFAGLANFVSCSRHVKDDCVYLRYIYNFMKNFEVKKTNRDARKVLQLAVKQVAQEVAEDKAYTIKRQTTKRKTTILCADASSDGIDGLPALGGVLVDERGDITAYTMAVPHLSSDPQPKAMGTQATKQKGSVQHR